MRALLCSRLRTPPSLIVISGVVRLFSPSFPSSSWEKTDVNDSSNMLALLIAKLNELPSYITVLLLMCGLYAFDKVWKPFRVEIIIISDHGRNVRIVWRTANSLSLLIQLSKSAPIFHVVTFLGSFVRDHQLASKRFVCALIHTWLNLYDVNLDGTRFSIRLIHVLENVDVWAFCFVFLNFLPFGIQRQNILCLNIMSKRKPFIFVSYHWNDFLLQGLSYFARAVYST